MKEKARRTTARGDSYEQGCTSRPLDVINCDVKKARRASGRDDPPIIWKSVKQVSVLGQRKSDPVRVDVTYLYHNNIP